MQAADWIRLPAPVGTSRIGFFSLCLSLSTIRGALHCLFISFVRYSKSDLELHFKIAETLITNPTDAMHATRTESQIEGTGQCGTAFI